ncbi:hypothetical protein D3C75_1129200 [compost metagenome]
MNIDTYLLDVHAAVLDQIQPVAQRIHLVRPLNDTHPVPEKRQLVQVLVLKQPELQQLDSLHLILQIGQVESGLGSRCFGDIRSRRI